MRDVSESRIKILVIRDSRHPWVLTILVGCIISGAAGLFLPPDPRTSIDQFVPNSIRAVYYAVLLAAGLVTLIGVFLPRFRDRLMLEMIGMWFISAPLLIYPIAIVTVVGVSVSPAAVITSLFGVGGLVRIIEIFLEIRTLRARSE